MKVGPLLMLKAEYLLFYIYLCCCFHWYFLTVRRRQVNQRICNDALHITLAYIIVESSTTYTSISILIEVYHLCIEQLNHTTTLADSTATVR